MGNKFSEEVRRELLHLPTPPRGKAIYELFGILSVAGSCRQFSTKNPLLVRKAWILAKTEGLTPTVNERKTPRGVRLTFSLLGSLPISNLYRSVSDGIGANLFLRGAFEARGSIAAPSRQYYAEIVVTESHIANLIVESCSKCGVRAASRSRKGKFVIYMHSEADIERLLRLLGAQSSLKRVSDNRWVRILRERTNRVCNAETANLRKVVNAGVKQAEILKAILEGGVKLPEDVLKVVRIRVENPSLSLKEIGEKVSPPMTKPAVYYRLRKALRYAGKSTQNSETP